MFLPSMISPPPSGTWEVAARAPAATPVAGLPPVAVALPAAAAVVPLVAGVVPLLLIAFTVHDLDRPAGADGYVHERVLLSPAVVTGCQVAIGVTMALILMITI